jgi:hypothetical protein
MTPQGRPETMIGAPARWRTPRSRASARSGPQTPAKLSMRADNHERDQGDKVGLQVNAMAFKGGSEEDHSRQNAEHDPGQRRPHATQYRDRDDHQQRGKQEPAQHERRPQRQRGERQQPGTGDCEDPRRHPPGGRSLSESCAGQTPQRAHDPESNRWLPGSGRGAADTSARQTAKSSSTKVWPPCSGSSSWLRVQPPAATPRAALMAAMIAPPTVIARNDRVKLVWKNL